jgi:hypothetical protein
MLTTRPGRPPWWVTGCGCAAKSTSATSTGFTRVLRSAVTAGVSTVDLSEVGFFAVAGVRALLVAAELLHEKGQPLTVIDPHVGRGRVLLLSVAADHPGIQLIHKGTPP